MDEIADRPAKVTLGQPELLAKGFHEYRRYELTVSIPGQGAVEQKRDVIAGGKVVAVLPVDAERDEVVLIRQFRLPGHLATGKGDMVEIVAGHADGGEVLADAARRECLEEIGVAPSKTVELFTYLTTPGMTDELVTVFLAQIDANAARERTATGGEHIRTIRVPVDSALEALSRNTIHNGPALMALQWLALNRARLKQVLGGYTHS
jgi:ADP-ribose diphosphatase